MTETFERIRTSRPAPSAGDQLAEQDPLINVRQDDIRREIYVSLYGEVQKQVIEATLATEYGLAADFSQTTPICVERPLRTGTAEEILHAPGNPFLATLGIRIDPAPAGTGTAFRLEIGHQAVPLYIYKNMENFAAAMEQYVTETLRQGLYGWQVTDCTVSLIRSQYSVPDGPPSVRGPLSSPQDFRKLTPLVVMAALKQCRHGGLRAGPPLPPGDPGRHAQRLAASPGQAARHPRGVGDQGRLVRPGGSHPGDQGA